MHSQNCSFLPSKKQPAFNGSLPHNIELLKSFSSKSFSKFDSFTHSSVNIQPRFEGLNPNQKSSRTASLMDFVYTFSDSSRKLRETISNRSIPTDKSRPSCKQGISHYNTVTQVPLFSSHLVGGFVGSKSQLGRRPTHGCGVNMWDIIRDLVNLVGDPSANIVDKENIRKNSFINKKCPNMMQVNNQENQINMGQRSSNINNRSTKLKETENVQKQSYADVAKMKLDLPLMEEMPSIEIPGKIYSQENSARDSNSKPVLEHFSVGSGSDDRRRIASECSIDSEDSFIVFEYCEGDDISIVDDNCSTSDDESVMDFEIINQESCTDNGSACLTTFDSTKDHKLSRKKVQFAEGKDLAEVHPMVVWDYAYRAARRSPWEMLARDAERFRSRIANTEAILSPVLDPAYREAIFQQRFASLDSGS